LEAGHKAQSIYANEDSVHHFRQALRAAQRVPGSEDRQLVAHEGLGEVLDTIGRYDEALTHTYHAQDLVMMIGYSPEGTARRLADLLRKTAQINERRSEYDTALNWLRGGLIAVEGIEAVEAARIYLLGSGVYQRQARYSEAIEWCHKSLDLGAKVGGRDGQSVTAYAYSTLGLVYYRLGDLARTIELCRKSLEIYEQLEELLGAVRAHINVANAYLDRGEQGDWPRGTEHYLRALEITRMIGDVHHQGIITLNLGSVYLDQGDLDQATRYYQQSLEMWQELGSTHMIAMLHNNMGTVALRRGEPDAALDLLQESLEMYQQIGSRQILPEIYRRQALAYLSQEKLDKSLDCAQRSLELVQEQELRLEEGATRRVLGQVYVAFQEMAQAEQELHESLHILEELHSRYEMGKTLFQLARLYRMQGDRARMEKNLQQAVAIFEDLGARLDLVQARELTSA
jgi:tetratricopeptide (TPR) repeat protein